MPKNEFDHPIRKGAMLQCTSEQENVEELLEVLRRYENIDTGEYEYELACPSHTGYYTYHQDDLDGIFSDTGLTNEEIKPIVDDAIRKLYQHLHDHTWHDSIDPETSQVTQEQCIHCRATRPVDG